MEKHVRNGLNYIRKTLKPHRRLREFLNRHLAHRRLWQRGVSSEQAFWEDVIRMVAEGSDHPYAEDIRQRLAADRPLSPAITELLDAPPGSTVDVLDVGAGPVTSVGYRWEERTVRVTPIDALAETYNTILEKYGVVPPVRTQQCHAEEIGEKFRPESFDLVHSQNALDHAYDPVAALQQAVILLKPGGLIFLGHHRNEAEYEMYGGLHQWNFDVQDGRFVIWNMKHRHVVEDMLPLPANVRAEVSDKNRQRAWIEVIIERQ